MSRHNNRRYSNKGNQNKNSRSQKSRHKGSNKGYKPEPFGDGGYDEGMLKIEHEPSPSGKPSSKKKRRGYANTDQVNVIARQVFGESKYFCIGNAKKDHGKEEIPFIHHQDRKRNGLRVVEGGNKPWDGYL